MVDYDESALKRAMVLFRDNDRREWADMDKLRTIVDRVQVRNPPYPITKHLHPCGDGTATLIVAWQVPDRDVPEKLVTINHYRTIDVRMPPDLIVSVVTNALRTAFDHEFAECLHVDGIRVNDPHAADIKAAELKAHWRGVNAYWKELTEGT